MTARLLIACIGNVFCGDDGFGVEVGRRLAAERLPSDVELVDFGIRGYDLALALLRPYQRVILVDAMPRGKPPGSLSVLAATAAPDAPAWDTHALDPARVFGLVEALGGSPPPMWIVGCEPASVGDLESAEVGLSAPVAAAIEPAVELIQALVAESRGAEHA